MDVKRRHNILEKLAGRARTRKKRQLAKLESRYTWRKHPLKTLLSKIPGTKANVEAKNITKFVKHKRDAAQGGRAAAKLLASSKGYKPSVMNWNDVQLMLERGSKSLVGEGKVHGVKAKIIRKTITGGRG